MRRRILISDAQGLTKCRGGFVRHLLLQVSHTSVDFHPETSVGVGSNEFHCRLRLGDLAGVAVRDPEIEEGQGVIRAQLDDALKLFHCCGKILHAVIVEPQKVVNGHGVWICFQCCIELLG